MAWAPSMGSAVSLNHSSVFGGLSSNASATPTPLPSVPSTPSRPASIPSSRRVSGTTTTDRSLTMSNGSGSLKAAEPARALRPAGRRALSAMAKGRPGITLAGAKAAGKASSTTSRTLPAPPAIRRSSGTPPPRQSEQTQASPRTPNWEPDVQEGRQTGEQGTEPLSPRQNARGREPPTPADQCTPPADRHRNRPPAVSPARRGADREPDAQPDPEDPAENFLTSVLPKLGGVALDCRAITAELGFEGDDEDDEDDSSEGGNFDLSDAPPPNGSYLARISAAVGAITSDGNTSFRLPEDVAAEHRAQQHRRLDLADRTTKADFTQSMCLIASSLQLTYEDVLSIALGEYIAVTTLRDSRLGSAHDVPEHLRVSYHLEERRSKPRTPPLDPYQWCQTFDTLECVLHIINVREPFEEARRCRAAAYREFIDLELRSEMARPVKEALVRHYGQCNDRDHLFQEIVLDPERRRERQSPPSVDSRALPRPCLDAISGYCGRTPGSMVGTAITLVMTLLALPAASGAVKAEEEDLAWAHEGIVYGADAIANGGLDDAAPTNRLAGISIAPHLLQAFHWPSPPLRADAFAAALADHPNRALRSPSPTPTSSREILPTRPSSSRTRVPDTARVEAKLISPAFDVLPEGCVVSPQFIVRRDGSAPRVVDDHSASGLNDGIGEAAAMYDWLDALVAILRYSGLVGETLPDHPVLYKLDVSATFKLLPMSPEWQMQQAILVPYRDASGELRPCYHLQWWAAFGSRASPSLWTNLVAAVGWIVRKRNSELVPWPLTYMDDTFGVDLSGRTAQVAHDSEVRKVPAAQAAIIAVWDELGPAWKWKKALHGRRLTITGIVVDLDDYSLSLKPEAVNKFNVAAASFLATPDGQPPLRHWRQLAGWANWALTVFINRAVKDSLAAFVAELETGAPLDLRDPALTRWDEKDVDVVLHTDACLAMTENLEESGLAFWTRTRTGPLVFSALPCVKYWSIQFTEGPAIYSAIDWALRKCPSARRWSKEGDEDRTPYRILVRTDSAPAVYAFGAGGTNQPDLAHLVQLAYADLHTMKVNLRVIHIRGKHNITADWLSRELVASLIESFGGSWRPFLPPLAAVEQAPSP
ncbi:hypothetical protein JCM5296_007215 [Sporobolomyces johnsonii]